MVVVRLPFFIYGSALKSQKEFVAGQDDSCKNPISNYYSFYISGH